MSFSRSVFESPNERYTFDEESPQGQAFSSMPVPGTLGAPFFDGDEITEFLDHYEEICENHHLENMERLERLPRYCNFFCRRYVQELDEFKKGDFEALKEILMKNFDDHHTTDSTESRMFLRGIKNKTIVIDTDLTSFCQMYHAYSERLVERGKLDRRTQASWFLQALPDSEREILTLEYAGQEEECELSCLMGSVLDRIDEATYGSRKHHE